MKQQLGSKIMLGVVVVLILAKFFMNRSPQPATNQNTINQITTNPTQNQNHTNYNPKSNSNIPPKVITVLDYIEQNHHAMPGYVGGRVFTNYEKVVPTNTSSGQPINYQEWDVNPHVQGVNRGTERILTGSDGRAWYTNDHYKTFTQIK